ncbi:MAG TPA: DUF4097 family beta strand repeat-containing protein [Terriglobia bacterium]|nr:DUF4097 family beta strand repeat-containing protein [Terriglobia bacterium]
MSVYTYRRGSIFWALTLIAVGTIFLYQNFNPSIHPWQLIAKFWPVLIIFWGLSKLIDYMQAHAHPETTPPPLFSASEVVLLVLILLMGTVLSKIILHPWQQWPSSFGVNVNDDDWANMFMNSYTFNQTLSQPFKPKSQLVIEDQRGDVDIRATDQSTIDISVKKVIKADNQADAQKLSDALKVEIAEEGGHYVLKSNRRSLPNDGANVSLDLTLSVPQTTSAEISSDRGDLSLSGLRGDQTLTVLHGDLHVSGVEGMVRVHKTGGLTEAHDVKGNVEVDGRGSDVEMENVTGSVTVNGDFTGSLQFRNVTQTLHYVSSRTDLTTQHLSGRLDMETGSMDASDIDGPFEISTRQKDITVENFRNSLKINNTNGDVQLRTSTAPTHPIEVTLGKGEIELDIPPSSSFQIDASSRRGEVDSEFSGLTVNKEGDTPSISGSNGKGGPAIHLTTSYGTIRLGNENGSSPRPPSPPSTPTPPRPPKTTARVFPQHLTKLRRLYLPAVRQSHKD